MEILFNGRKRAGEYLPVFEDERGTYIFNSKDLCMIHKIPELIRTGVNSFKIEGRMKSIHYIACVVSAYRKAIDEYFKDPSYQFDQVSLKISKKQATENLLLGFILVNLVKQNRHMKAVIISENMIC